MNKREIGDKLDYLVVSYIKEIEPKCRKTKASGGSTELEDILSSYFLVQDKVDNTHSNIIIKIKDWQKLINKLPVNSKRIPIFVNQQKDGTITVTLKIDDYFRTVYRSYNATGEIQ